MCRSTSIRSCLSSITPWLLSLVILGLAGPVLAADPSATNHISVELVKSPDQGPKVMTFLLSSRPQTNSYKVTARKPLFDIINNLRPQSDILLFDDESLANDRYDLTLISTGNCDDQARWEAFQRALKEKLKLGLVMRTRKVESIELHLASGGPKGFTKATAGEDQKHTMVARGYRFINSSMEDFVAWLDENLPQPVSDKTGLKGDYSFTLPCWPTSPEVILAALPKLGLVPKALTNDTQVLMIERARD